MDPSIATRIVLYIYSSQKGFPINLDFT